MVFAVHDYAIPMSVLNERLDIEYPVESAVEENVNVSCESIVHRL